MSEHEPPDSATGLPGGSDVLAGLLAEPFRISRPGAQTLPFVFASPHSGRLYPQSLIRASRLDPLALRRSEDAFVDELFAGVAAMGAPLIAARFPRAYCDANRAVTELDVAMFSGPLEIAVEAPTARVGAGLGVIPRIVRDGAEIYRRKLEPGEARLRLAYFYRPYHAALAGLVEETLTRFGTAVVVDCHSMPSALSVPDIVLGDRFGTSALPVFTAWAQQAFMDEGFSVTRNAPYAGGHTTTRYGQEGRGCQALQIEINRSLYLDEDAVRRKPGFDALKARLTRALTRLVAVDPALACRRNLSQAAE